MCFFQQPKMNAPQLPPEPAAARAPDRGAIASEARRRTTERARSSTALTGDGGADAMPADTAKKTLLGQ